MEKGRQPAKSFFIVIKISPFLAGAAIPGGSIFVHRSVAEMVLQTPGVVVYAGSIPAAASILHNRGDSIVVDTETKSIC